MRTFQMLIDAIRQNGMPKATHAYYRNGAACAFGQANVNLGGQPISSVANNLDNDYYNRVKKLLGIDAYSEVPAEFDIVSMNDTDNLSLEEIADRLQDTFAERGWLEETF